MDSCRHSCCRGNRCLADVGWKEEGGCAIRHRKGGKVDHPE